MSVNVRATGTGASLSAASGGDGAGGTAAITVQDGAALNASNFVGVDATALGGTGGAASGDGLGGGAFALPLLWFAWKRAIPKGYGWRLTALFALGEIGRAHV